MQCTLPDCDNTVDDNEGKGMICQKHALFFYTQRLLGRCAFEGCREKVGTKGMNEFYLEQGEPAVMCDYHGVEGIKVFAELLHQSEQHSKTCPNCSRGGWN